MGIAIEEHALEQETVCLRERAQRGFDQRLIQRIADGWWRNEVEGRIVGFTVSGLGPGTAGAQTFKTEVVGDGQNEGLYGAARRVITPGLSVQTKERILYGFLSIFGRGKHPQADPVGQGREFVIQRPKGVWMFLLEPHDEIVMGMRGQ